MPIPAIRGCDSRPDMETRLSLDILPQPDELTCGPTCLHAAVRLVLPLLPAIPAASPVVNARVTGRLDNRIEMYCVNQARIPSITGQVILDEGPLARRIIRVLGPEPDHDRLAAVYRELCDCLKEGRMYHV